MRRLMMAVLMAAALPALAGPQGAPAVVTGYVIDSACLFLKNLEKPVGKECAVSCARAGSPLVILAEDGTVYLPVSSAMPATGQNGRLIKFAGEKVTIHGSVFERGGSHALLIETIEVAPVPR